MPHTTVGSMLKMERTSMAIKEVVGRVKIQMAMNDDFRKYMEDSVYSLATGKDGELRMVFDFAPGASYSGGNFHKLCGALKPSNEFNPAGSTKAGGSNVNNKYVYDIVSPYLTCRLVFNYERKEQVKVEDGQKEQ